MSNQEELKSMQDPDYKYIPLDCLDHVMTSPKKKVTETSLTMWMRRMNQYP